MTKASKPRRAPLRRSCGRTKSTPWPARANTAAWLNGAPPPPYSAMRARRSGCFNGGLLAVFGEDAHAVGGGGHVAGRQVARAVVERWGDDARAHRLRERTAGME